MDWIRGVNHRDACFLSHQSAGILSATYILAEQYYLRNNDESLTARNLWAEWTDRLAYISAITFVCGIILLLVYFSINLPANPKGQSMTTANSKPDTGKLVDNAASIPQLQKAVEGGASIPRMQADPTEDRGASIPQMRSAPPQSQPSTEGGSSGSSGSRN